MTTLVPRPYRYSRISTGWVHTWTYDTSLRAGRSARRGLYNLHCTRASPVGLAPSLRAQSDVRASQVTLQTEVLRVQGGSPGGVRGGAPRSDFCLKHSFLRKIAILGSRARCSAATSSSAASLACSAASAVPTLSIWAVSLTTLSLGKWRKV